MIRLREAFAIWRLEGYDGRPTTWRDAWDLATRIYPVGEKRKGRRDG